MQYVPNVPNDCTSTPVPVLGYKISIKKSVGICIIRKTFGPALTDDKDHAYNDPIYISSCRPLYGATIAFMGEDAIQYRCFSNMSCWIEGHICDIFIELPVVAVLSFEDIHNFDLTL